LYGAFVWARRALTSQNRWVPARAAYKVAAVVAFGALLIALMVYPFYKVCPRSRSEDCHRGQALTGAWLTGHQFALSEEQVEKKKRR
jgi:hypothetical protein